MHPVMIIKTALTLPAQRVKSCGVVVVMDNNQGYQTKIQIIKLVQDVLLRDKNLQENPGATNQ